MTTSQFGFNRPPLSYDFTKDPADDHVHPPTDSQWIIGAVQDANPLTLSNEMTVAGQYIRFERNVGPMGIMFTGGLTSGHEAKMVYRTNNDELVFEAGDDNDVLVLQGFGATIGASPQVLVPSGDLAAPSIGMIDDEDTGIRLRTGDIQLITGGNIRIYAASGGDAGIRDPSGNSVAWHDDSTATWRINKQSGASQDFLLLVEDNATDRFRVYAASHTSGGDITMNDAAGSNVYRWDESLEDHVFYTDSGSTRVTIDAGGIISHTFGTAGSPSVEIDGRGGMWSPSVGVVSLGGIDYEQIRLVGSAGGNPGDIVMYDAAGGEVYRWDDSAQDHEWRDSASNLMRLQSTRLDLNWDALDFLGLPVKTTTGHPSSPAEGDMYVNTGDSPSALYVQADSAWRTIATW